MRLSFTVRGRTDDFPTPRESTPSNRHWQFPMLLGKGKRLFGEGTPPGALRLIDSVRSSTGVMLNRYARAGAVKVGSFALE